MVNQIYSPELQLNKTNTIDTTANIWIYNLFVSSKIYDKCDDFDFDIVNFPGFFYDDAPRRISFRVYILQLIRFNFCMLWTSMREINNISSRAISIINFETLFLNSIADTID